MPTSRPPRKHVRIRIVNVSRIVRFFDWLFGLPLLWGGLVSVIYYGALEYGLIHNALLQQYTARHAIERIETTVFFIGAAALVMRLGQLLLQFSVFEQILLEAVPDGGQRVDE